MYMHFFIQKLLKFLSSEYSTIEKEGAENLNGEKHTS